MWCFGLLFTLLHNSSKTADDIVKNNDQVILAGLEAETFLVIGTYDNNYNKKSWQDQVKIFLILLNLSTTKKWKFVDLKFTYKKTVWSHPLPGLEAETFWLIGTHDNDYNKKSWQDQEKIFWLCWI